MVSIYAIKSPITNNVFYIGASLNPKQRFRTHFNCKHWHPITRKYREMMAIKDAGLKPEFMILGEAERENAKELEQFFIDYYIGLGNKLSQCKTSSYPRNRYESYITKYITKTTP
jgi:hypothetical protein